MLKIVVIVFPPKEWHKSSIVFLVEVLCFTCIEIL